MIVSVDSKYENYKLYESGFYGNQLKQWPSVDAFYDDCSSGLWNVNEPVALRLKNKPGIELEDYCKPRMVGDICTNIVPNWVVDHGINREDIVVNEIGPDENITLQGEVRRDEQGLSLRYSNAKTIMRHAWPIHESWANGLKAKMMLEYFMDHNSYHNLMRLLEIFPDSVIEFSCYDISVGNLKWNTVFWEVRNY